MRRVLRGIAPLAALAALGALYIAFVGVEIDASALRGKIAARFSGSMGREVRFDGPLQLEISAHPSLRAGGFHVADAPGFSGSDFASVGSVRLTLDLWLLLRLRLQIEELSGSDVHIRLQSHKDGSNNWTLGPPGPNQAGSSHAAAPAPGARAASSGLGRMLARLDVKRVSLDKLEVEYVGAEGRSHFFELTSLVARFPAGQPVSLALNGTVERKYPYELAFTGGTLADLAHADQPWPVDLTLAFMSSRLALNGSISGSSGEINFGLGTEDLNEFERLFQTSLPEVGVSGMSGKVRYAPGRLTLESLNGVMGRTTLNGALALDYGGARPNIQGELTLPVLDLRPFISGKPAQQAPPQSLAETYRELARATFSMKALNSADADLTLRVGQWLSLPGGVHDAMLRVKLKQGRLTVPLRAVVAGVALAGSASADARVTPARFRLALGAHDSSAGNLAGLLTGAPEITGAPGVTGQLGRLSLRVSARGDRGAELMQSLDVLLEVERGKLSYGDGAAGRAVRFSLDSLVVALPAGRPLRGEAHGALLDKAFSASLQGGTLTDIMQGAHAPVDFSFQAGSVSAELHSLLEPSATKTSFDLTVPHSGEAAGWLGLKAGSDAPVRLKGSFTSSEGRWHQGALALRLGHSALNAVASQTFEQGRALLKVQLGGELIDVGELQALLPEARKDAAPAAPQPAAASLPAASLIDIPILPHGISLADADIAVRIQRLASASPIAVRDLRFDGSIRDGMMSASPFAANVADTDFHGAMMLDLRTEQPHAMLWVAADAVNVGAILKQLGIAGHVDAGIDHAGLLLDLHSSRLGEMLAQSDLMLNFEGGHFTLQDANTGGQMRIALDRGELRSAAGAAVNLELFGSLASAPVFINIATARAADLLDPARAIPFRLNATVADAAIQLSGDIDRPFSKTDIELALDMTGGRLDNLNPLVRAALPPWGPWLASGKFHMSPAGYEVSSLLLQVGSSQLKGQGRLDTTLVPPRLDVALTAPAIQLDDFRFGNWSPEKARPGAARAGDAPGKQAAEARAHAQQLLSREVLQRQNAYLKVRVDQVLSGGDALGQGRLDAKLEDGRVDIGPVMVNTPGGNAMLRFAYAPGAQDVAVSMQAEVKRLDYGILARRMDPKTDMQGTVSLDVDVRARAQDLSGLLPNGSGHINFAVWPQNMKSGKLDLWAVNVLVALLPAIDSSNASKVNCAIGRFELSGGKLSGKKILIDTSRMRVTGKGGADFATEKVALYLRPRSKTPQFLSLAVPIQLTGSFDDFHVGVSPLDAVGMAGELATSVIWVPLEMMFGKTIPADGSDVCTDAAFN